MQTNQNVNEWNLFISDSASRLTVHERRQTLVMILDYFMSELLLLTDDNRENSTTGNFESTTMNSMEERAVYYVGGYFIRKLLKKYENAETPLDKEIKGLLDLCKAGERFTLPEAAEWTELVNRGHLIFITVQCYEFYKNLERFALNSINPCPSVESAVQDEDVQSAASSISHFGQFSNESVNNFVRIIAKEFLRLRGKALAKKKFEIALNSDGLMQERRGIRDILQCLETDRMNSERNN